MRVVISRRATVRETGKEKGVNITFGSIAV